MKKPKLPPYDDAPAFPEGKPDPRTVFAVELLVKVEDPAKEFAPYERVLRHAGAQTANDGDRLLVRVERIEELTLWRLMTSLAGHEAGYLRITRLEQNEPLPEFSPCFRGTTFHGALPYHAVCRSIEQSPELDLWPLAKREVARVFGIEPLSWSGLPPDERERLLKRLREASKGRES